MKDLISSYCHEVLRPRIGTAETRTPTYENSKYICSLIRLPRSLFPKRPCEVSTRMIGATIEAQRSMHSEYLEQQMIYNSSIFRTTRNVIAPPEELVRYWSFQISDFNLCHEAEHLIHCQILNSLRLLQVTQLTEMGFNRENAIQALQTTNNNLQMATNMLLNQ